MAHTHFTGSTKGQHQSGTRTCTCTVVLEAVHVQLYNQLYNSTRSKEGRPVSSLAAERRARMVASDEYVSADDETHVDSPFVTVRHAAAEVIDMMAVEPPPAHVTRTVSPYSASRVKIERPGSASMRSLRTVLSRHPTGQRILHVGTEEQVQVLLADPAVVEAASQPPSKEVALELRDAFAHVFCTTAFADCGVSVEERPTQRAIESLVASWDWDLSRVEENVARHVVRLAGGGLFEKSDISFVNFLLELPECRQARLHARGAPKAPPHTHTTHTPLSPVPPPTPLTHRSPCAAASYSPDCPDLRPVPFAVAPLHRCSATRRR